MHTHHHRPVEKKIRKAEMDWVDPQWCQRYESERSTLPLLAGSEWIMDLIKTILRVAMKWKLVINAKCDAALSRLLDWSQFCDQTILSNFWKREKMQNCLHCSLTSKKKLQMWASALSLSLDGPPLTSKAVSKLVKLTNSPRPAVFVKRY